MICFVSLKISGGSGLAVLGPSNDPRGRPAPGGSGNNLFDAVVQRASQAESAPPSSGSAPSGGGNEYRISLYRNGFTVNNGPLRDPNDAENRGFMLALMEGRIPDEIARSVREQGGRLDELDVNLEDKRSEDYKPPTPPPYVAFSGSGNSLGSIVRGDAFIFRSSNLLSVSTAIDESQPTTTVQVRTANGKRLRIRINTTMTVLQLAAITLRESGAEGSDVSFTLSAGFPPKDLSDALATVADAGLQNAAVTQKTL